MASTDLVNSMLPPSEHQMQLRRAFIESIAIYIAICVTITLIATVLMTDYTARTSAVNTKVLWQSDRTSRSVVTSATDH
jgi:heme/copper-type cytochrome/quinol oxidase subunit 2